MDIFRNRPLFLWCAAFTAASAGGFFLFGQYAEDAPLAGPALVLLIAAPALLGVGIGIPLWVRRHRRGAVTLILAALLLSAGLGQSYAHFNGRQARHFRTLAHETVTVRAIAVDRPVAGGQLTNLSLELIAVNGQSAEGLATMTCSYSSDINVGDIIEMQAEVIPPDEAVGDGYSTQMMQGDGYVLWLQVTDEQAEQVIGQDTDYWRVRAGNLRRALAYRLESVVGEEAAGLPSALLLGDKSHLTNEAQRDFGRAGVSHLLAISGLHMTLLFGLLEGILRLVRVPRRMRAVLLSVAAIGYLVLLGFPPSATRAVIMLGFVYLSALLSAQADAVTALGVAGACILACTPYAAADAGFWMSYLATLGLVTMMPLVNSIAGSAGRRAARGRFSVRAPVLAEVLARLQALLIKLGTGLLVGIIAMSFTLSVVAAVIGEMGILSPVATLVLTPLCGAVLLLSLFLLPVAYTDAGQVLGRLIARICSLMTELAERMAEPRWAVVSLVHPLILPVALLMAGALLILLAVRLPKGRRWVLMLPLLVGWTAIGGILAVTEATGGDKPAVSFLQPSSQSDMLILTQGRDAVICDLSNGSYSSLHAAATEASRRGATEIAALVLTHYHRSHSGALFELLGRETVRALWVPRPASTEDYHFLSACLETAERAGVPVVIYDLGSTLQIFGDCVLTVEDAALSRSVQPICLLSLDTEPLPDRGGELVYCGSSLFESELSDAAAARIARADAVIFGNHGPLIKEPFGGTLTFAEDAHIVLSQTGDVSAYFDASAVPDSAAVWLGAWRFDWP